jgi:bacillithiol biosynthesis cysteine-adding enzyme BshC
MVTSHAVLRPRLSGEATLKSECLPFSQIPHTTRLFSDFLASDPKLQNFYPRTAFFSSWFRQESGKVRYDDARRQQVGAVLERQNQRWNASPQTLENLARFKNGALTVVTGQQVGLFGGPLFSILKALTAVRLAELASKAGIDCVPIFWLATEDHDLAEVNHVALSGADRTLRTFSVPTSGVKDAPVGTLRFGDEIDLAVDEAVKFLGDGEVRQALRQSYRPGETFGSAFGRLFAQLFAKQGVILLDAGDAELHRIAKPIYTAGAERSSELNDALLERGKALESAGYHQQVKVTPSSTLLFDMGSGSRIPVHRRPNGRDGSGEFMVGDRKVAQSELVQRIEQAPQDFSANVLLRPVLQDYLLPTLAYSGGAAEIAYFGQAAVVYEAILGRVTPIVPRFSATIVEQKAQSLMEKYRLRLPDLFRGEEGSRELLGARSLPLNLQGAFAHATDSLERSLGEVRNALAQLDTTLVDSSRISESKMRYQLNQIRARAARAELRKREILHHHAQLLSNALYPNRTLQERVLGGISLLSRMGPQLLDDLYQVLNPDCLDHQIISV